MLKESNHFIVQGLTYHPLKISARNRNARTYNSFISQEKDKRQSQNVRKRCN